MVTCNEILFEQFCDQQPVAQTKGNHGERRRPQVARVGHQSVPRLVSSFVLTALV